MLVLGLVDIPWWGILLIAVVIFLIYDTWDFDYFKKQGIPGPHPVPILGTLISTFTKALPYVELEDLEKYGHKGFYGAFLGTRPMLVVYDADMLSQITVKHFQAFTNRFSLDTNSRLNDSMIISLKDAQWRHVRNEMSPAFTIGKLKRMSSEINRCAQAMADSLLEAANASEDVELKGYAGGFTMDVIAGTAFGIRLDSQKDKNNPFVVNARRAMDIDPTNISFMMVFFFPRLSKFLLKLGFTANIIPKDIRDFFEVITKQTMEMRSRKEDETRTDFIQLMMKARRGESIQEDNVTKGEPGNETPEGITNDEIFSNALLFFMAGYDTTSTSLAFLMYNMARYPDVQDKLVKEIHNVIGDADSVDYDKLQDMPYLDQCVNENLRLYTPGVRLDRVATRDITINGVFIRKGVLISLPYFSIHRDPKRWPNPEEFDPDRFSPENKKKHHPMDFVPFGAGPRICLAMRLALQELKFATIHILRKVKVSTCEKTQIPIIFEKNVINLLRAEGGIYLKVKPRNMQ